MNTSATAHTRLVCAGNVQTITVYPLRLNGNDCSMCGRLYASEVILRVVSRNTLNELQMK